MIVAVLIESRRRVDMRLDVFIFMIDRLSGRETLKKPDGFSHQIRRYSRYCARRIQTQVNKSAVPGYFVVNKGK